MQSSASISPGDIVLNKYRVERVLGRGGMGIVVAARHIELDELFAIKLMLPSIAENREAAERFLREARAAAKLKGDHVARVQDVGRLPDGTSYMVMEYLTGSDLQHVVRTQGPLPVDAAVKYVLQACETLKEAHELGIVHRDIKPANIFLARGPNGVPRVKVIDFGISKHTAGDTVGLTATSTVGGSPLYMSPEQMRSTKYVDQRTDIWAIGIVLYELLTGTTPFHADTITAVAGRVLQDEPSPPSQQRADVSTWIDSIVLRCLQKRPEHRFQSMEELMLALRFPLPATVTLDQSALDGPTVPLTRAASASITAATVPFPEINPATRGGPLEQSTTSSTTGGFGQVAAVNKPSIFNAHRPRKRARLAPLLIAVVVLAVATGTFIWARSPVDSAVQNSTNNMNVNATGVEDISSAELNPRSSAPEPIMTGASITFEEPSSSAAAAGTSATLQLAKAAINDPTSIPVGAASAANSTPPMVTATPPTAVATKTAAPAVVTVAPSAATKVTPTVRAGGSRDDSPQTPPTASQHSTKSDPFGDGQQ